MFYLLHGDDEFTCRERLKELRQQGNFDYNQDTYYGGETDLVTITATCSTLPFLSEQRLVVVEGLPKKGRAAKAAAQEGDAAPTSKKGSRAKKSKKASKGAPASRADFEKGLAEFIATMPEETVLILLIDETLEATNPLIKAAQAHGREIKCLLPRGAAVESWITKRAKSIGVNITSAAAAMLANFIGNHLRLLANELDKLATYVGPGGTIDVDAVHLLSAQVQETRIFDLTDALAQRNRKEALDILHDLLNEGEPPLLLINIMTTQVRTLLLVKELAQKGLRGAQIAEAIGVKPFIADKALRQVRQFSLPQLESAYRSLLDADAALKRSRMSPEVALDLFVVNFGSQGSGVR